MTLLHWLWVHWGYAAGGLLLILAAIAFKIGLILARDYTEIGEFDAELDEIAALPYLSEDGVVASGAVPDAGPDEDTQVVPDRGDEGGRPVDGGRPPVLTPRQRRRAVHKGRIPRDLPAPADRSYTGKAPMVVMRRGGESSERLLSPVLAAELETGRLVATMRDESRQAEAAAVWAEIGGLVDDAYRWWSAPGRWELAA